MNENERHSGCYPWGSEKKPNIFKRLKRWWKYDLTEDDRDAFKIAGIWCLDGALFGSIITGAVAGGKAKKMQKQALVSGYIQGQMDAYKEMAQNPQYKPVGIYSNQMTKKFDAKH